MIKFKMYSFHVLKGLTLNFLYNRPFDKKWDNTLSGWLDEVDKGELKAELCSYTINFTKECFYKEVWVANEWYAYGHLYCTARRSSIDNDSQFRPSIKTMIRLEELSIKLKAEQDVKDAERRAKLYN